MTAEQKDRLYLLIGITLTEGSFKARQRMAALAIDFFSSEQSRVVDYLIGEAEKRS
jgi:hypothetical protein